MRAMKPEISVVIPSVNGLGDLVGCLEALEAQREDVRLEVLVVDRLGDSVIEVVGEKFPEARIIPMERSVTIPEMRAKAFDEATGAAVAVIEDHVIVPPGWARHLLDALENSSGVVGGSVENAATDTLMDWACFLCEYSHCIPPLDEGVVDWVTGNNVVYRADLLDRHREATAAGKWENHLHEVLKGDGVDLVCRPEIVVGHKKHYSFMEYFTQRYLYSRSYAGMRAAEASRARTLVLGALSLALPPLLFARTLRNILAKGGHTATLIKSLPLIAIFCCSWAVGEAVGYWFGGGDALKRVC